MGRTKREELLQWSNLASGQFAGEAMVYVDPDGRYVPSYEPNAGGGPDGYGGMNGNGGLFGNYGGFGGNGGDYGGFGGYGGGYGNYEGFGGFGSSGRNAYGGIYSNSPFSGNNYWAHSTFGMHDGSFAPFAEGGITYTYNDGGYGYWSEYNVESTDFMLYTKQVLSEGDNNSVIEMYKHYIVANAEWVPYESVDGRFFMKNTSYTGKMWQTYNSTSSSPAEWNNLTVNFGLEITAGVQAGGGANFQGIGPMTELNLAYLQLLEFGYSSTQGGFGWNGAGRNGLFQVGNRITIPFAEAYQTFDTRGTGYRNHQQGASVGPAAFGTQGYGFDFSASASFIVGIRLNFSLLYKP